MLFPSHDRSEDFLHFAIILRGGRGFEFRIAKQLALVQLYISPYGLVFNLEVSLVGVDAGELMEPG